MSIMDGMRMQDKFLYFLAKTALALHIMRVDFGMETFGKDYEDNLIVNIVAETKWFWERRSPKSPYSM